MNDRPIKWPRSFAKATELSGDELSALVEALIAEMDHRDGDPDLEDSEVGSHLVGERGHLLPNACVEPAQDEDREQASWTEWHTRGGHKLQSGDEPVKGLSGGPVHEDAEDDDPPEANGDESDGNASEDDFMRHSGRHGPGCSISDPDGSDDSASFFRVPTYGVDQSRGVMGELAAADSLETVPVLSAHKKRRTLRVVL